MVLNEKADGFRWSKRILLGLLAFMGTAGYAASFMLHQELLPAAREVGVAAGCSWPVFGAALLAISRGKPSAMSWADQCLATMGIGMGILIIGVLVNLLSGLGGYGAGHAVTAAHIAILAAANVLMGIFFVFRAVRLGMKRRTAILLWVCVLDGVFLILLTARLVPGGSLPW